MAGPPAGWLAGPSEGKMAGLPGPRLKHDADRTKTQPRLEDATYRKKTRHGGKEEGNNRKLRWKEEERRRTGEGKEEERRSNLREGGEARWRNGRRKDEEG